MITIQDVQDAFLLAQAQAQQSAEETLMSFYQPEIEQSMDLVWSKLPEEIKAEMRRREPDYARELDSRAKGE